MPSASAQFFSAGNDPSNVKWKQVKDGQIKIVFPEGYEDKALQLLKQLNVLKLEASKTLRTKISPISVVLHNQTAQANGFVAWAPKRMELYTLADQGTYAQDWLEQLAIHEFRHVVQINSMRQGLTKVLSFLLGEQAIGAVIGLYVPVWFLEGDAVTFETANTKAGRGRSPSFFIPYISMLDKYGTFFYEKAVFGSYKHYIPDNYVVGYHLVSYTRFHYGDSVWQQALNRIARRPYSIMPLSAVLKKNTGYSKFNWYKYSASGIGKLYTDEFVATEHLSTLFSLKAPAEDYISYRFPQYLNDSIIVVEKSGLSHVKEWVTIDRNGNERHLYYPGFYNITNASVGNGKLYYSEYNFDLRWEHRTWTDVICFDIKKRKKKRLTHKTYATAPSVYNDKLVYINQNSHSEFQLVVLDADNVQTIPSPNNEMLYTPNWDSDSTILCIALDKENGKYFTRCNLKSKQWTKLSDPLFYDIHQPIIWNQYIIHRGAYEGKEQLYAYDTLSTCRYRITREPYEATDPSIRNNTVLFSSYTANGYEVKEQALDTATWIKIYLQNDHWDNPITKTISEQERFNAVMKVDTVEHHSSFSIKKYRRMAHLFNFHSWAPLHVDVDNVTVNSGASIFSQNLLSTSFLSLGYLYDNVELTGKWNVNYQYTGLYPVLSFNISHGDRFMLRYGKWKQAELNAAIAFPFNLTHGPYAERLTFTLAPHWQSIYDVEEGSRLVNQDLTTLSYKVDYSRLFRMSARDLRARKGQALFFQYRHAPMGDFSYSSFVAGAISVWMPSFSKHHSIFIKAQGHHYDKGGYYLSSPIAFPRGYSYAFSPDLLRTSIDYSFPLLYPDFRMTALFYIKRIKMNLFYDAAWTFDSKNNELYDSKGVDIRVDFHFANFLAPIDLGFRIYHLNQKNLLNYQILMSYQLGR